MKEKQKLTSEFDKVSYSEGVKINIGEYEHRDIHISYSTAIRDDEDFSSALQRARRLVRSAVMAQEKRIRLTCVDDVPFDTMSRLMREAKD